MHHLKENAFNCQCTQMHQTLVLSKELDMDHTVSLAIAIVLVSLVINLVKRLCDGAKAIPGIHFATAIL